MLTFQLEGVSEEECLRLCNELARALSWFRTCFRNNSKAMEDSADATPFCGLVTRPNLAKTRSTDSAILEESLRPNKRMNLTKRSVTSLARQGPRQPAPPVALRRLFASRYEDVL